MSVLRIVKCLYGRENELSYSLLANLNQVNYSRQSRLYIKADCDIIYGLISTYLWMALWSVKAVKVWYLAVNLIKKYSWWCRTLTAAKTLYCLTSLIN